MAQRVGGVAYIKVDGGQIALAGSASFVHSTIDRQELAGIDGSIDYTEAPVVPRVEFDAKTVKELDFTVLQNYTNVTVTFEAANGNTYTLRNAFQSGELSHDGVAGTAGITFKGTLV